MQVGVFLGFSEIVNAILFSIHPLIESLCRETEGPFVKLKIRLFWKVMIFFCGSLLSMNLVGSNFKNND